MTLTTVFSGPSTPDAKADRDIDQQPYTSVVCWRFYTWFSETFKPAVSARTGGGGREHYQ